MPDPIKLFYSYSQIDEKYRDDLEKSLKMLSRYDDLIEWHFRDISPGEDWDKEIRLELESADIILLLISRDFLASDYCYDIEVLQAMKQYESGQSIVIPVILRECDWKHENCPFKKLQAIPKNGHPISQWADRDTAFNDVTQRLKEAIVDIKQKKNEKFDAKKKVVTEEEESAETIEAAVKLFSQEAAHLNYNSSKEDYENIETLKRKLYSELIGKLDDKIKNIPALRDKRVQDLFLRIYASEKLDEITIAEIQELRDDKTNYKWFERKVIISAVALSLISFKKFDQKKSNLLLDFITDFEPIVWENALSGLILSLLYHQNKWEKFDDLKKRLASLKHIDEVQNGLNFIETILRLELFKSNNFDKKLFTFPFFDTPFNCFLPFFDKNLVLENALQNNMSDIDPEEFVHYINTLPFLDSQKYFLCLNLEKGNLIKHKLTGEEQKYFLEPLRISYYLHPFQNILTEYYNFFNFYPKSKIEDVFSKHLSITSTKLKNLVLNKRNELVLSADALISEGNLRGGIGKLQELLNFEPNNEESLWQISLCYFNLKIPEYRNALKNLLLLEKNATSANVKLLTKIAECYRKLDDYENALRYLHIAQNIDSKNRDLLIQFVYYYEDKDEYEKVVDVCALGRKIYPTDVVFSVGIAIAYKNLKKYRLAKEYFLESIKICPKEDLQKTYNVLCLVCCDLEEFDEALKYGHMSLTLGSKHYDTLFSLGRTYFIGKIDISLARKYLERAVAIKPSGIVYGNLGHLELCEGNDTKALEYYQKCVLLFESINEFEDKFNTDLPFVCKYGVSEEKYFGIKDWLTDYWKMNYKKT